MFVGKYLNQLRDEVKPHQLKRHAKGWDAFDIIYENNGKYFNYDHVVAEGGRETYGSGKSEHSTLVTKRQLVEQLKAAPDDQPLFAFASIYDLHAAEPARAEVRGRQAAAARSRPGPRPATTPASRASPSSSASGASPRPSLAGPPRCRPTARRC